MKILQVLLYYLKFKYLHKFRDANALKKWQYKKLKKHLMKVNELSTFYNKLSNKESIENLPVMDKKMMMENFNEINTVGLDLKEAMDLALYAEENREFSGKIKGITVGLSSGTSGNRGIFVTSDKESYMWAGATLAKLLPGGILRKHKVAFFMRANSNLYQSVESGRISFKFFDIYADMESHLDNLQNYRPNILVGAPSVLLIIAKAQKEGRIDIKPEKIISIAEVLEDEDKDYIEKVFGNRVHQVYQCTEGFLGCTCEHGTIHINEDIVKIEKEYIDDKRFYPIITDFCRISQPIINYRLNDILVEKKDGCKCGSPFMAIEKIEGREDDIFYIQSKDKGVVRVFPDFIRNAVIASSDKIEQYQVVQLDYSHIKICLQIDEKDRDVIEESVRSKFIKLFNDLGCEIPELIFDVYVPPEKGRKLIRIRREFIRD